MGSRWIALLPLVVCSCLAADDRPPPGSLTFTVSSSTAVAQGFTTEDGWSVAFAKVLAALGAAGFGGDEHFDKSCDVYATAFYSRVFNLLAGNGQKISQHFALGHCQVRYAVLPPDLRSLLGAGTSEVDRSEMLIMGGDRWVPEGRISMIVQGTAVRGGSTKAFRWVFRETVAYSECRVAVNGVDTEGVDLRGEEAQVYDVMMEPERLLRDDTEESTARLRFEPMAGADSNGDGDVTLEELAGVPLDGLRGIAPYGTQDAEGIETLGDYVYRLLLPTVSRFRGTGTCKIQTGSDMQDLDWE